MVPGERQNARFAQRERGQQGRGHGQRREIAIDRDHRPAPAIAACPICPRICSACAGAGGGGGAGGGVGGGGATRGRGAAKEVGSGRKKCEHGDGLSGRTGGAKKRADAYHLIKLKKYTVAL